jgi:glycine cleavage system H protein
MDGFSYYNIFETKGIEYLIIISFLILIVPFWLLINKKASISARIKNAFGVLTTSILKIPQGIYFSGNHTWSYLEKSGTASVGIDDLLIHLTGDVSVRHMQNKGSEINKGDILAEIENKGKVLQIKSPISGSVVKVNGALIEDPGLLNEDPYGKGWMYKIKPSAWTEETSSFYLAESAADWIKNELDRFRDFLAHSLRQHSANSLAVLQDGGELCDKPLSELPAEVWQDFQKSFLN